jgi:metal-dependent hydrolase (beta-lactamase superfamily II)
MNDPKGREIVLKLAGISDIFIHNLIPGSIEKLGLGYDEIDYVIVTHLHLDHAGGAGLLVRELNRAQLLVHERGARHMVNPERLLKSVLAGSPNTRTVFYAHEVASVRPIVEKLPLDCGVPPSLLKILDLDDAVCSVELLNMYFSGVDFHRTKPADIKVY